MARKLVFSIFISIFAIFLMSHNASAVQPVFDISNYDIIANYTWPYIGCKYSNSGDYTFVNAICSLNNTNKNLYALSLPPAPSGMRYETGDIVQFDAVVYGNSSTLTIGSTYAGGITNPFDLPYVAGSNDFSILSVEPVYFENNNALINYYNSITCRAQGTATFCEGYPELTNDLAYYQAYRFTVRFKNNLSNRLQLQSSTTIPLFSLNSTDSRSTADIRITRINIYRPIETQENKEVEQKTQEAVDESSQSGESSQGSVEGSTQNLMSAGASIISALSNAPATDCNINMSTSGSSSAFTGAIGSVNLCSGVPSGVLTMVQGVVALVFTPIVLYYTYSIITTIYKQFREYNS